MHTFLGEVDGAVVTTLSGTLVLAAAGKPVVCRDLIPVVPVSDLLPIVEPGVTGMIDTVLVLERPVTSDTCTVVEDPRDTEYLDSAVDGIDPEYGMDVP